MLILNRAKRVNSWDSQGLNSQDARTEESAADKNSLFNQAKRKSPVMHSIKEKPAKNLVIKVNDEYDIQGCKIAWSFKLIFTR